jgi:hypothetical protein
LLGSIFHWQFDKHQQPEKEVEEMVTLDDCAVITSHPMGLRVLCYCFADKSNRSQAFESFCSLFAKGKSAANPNAGFARIAHRQMFATLAGISSNHRDIGKMLDPNNNNGSNNDNSSSPGGSNYMDSLQVSYVDVCARLSGLGTIRPWPSFRTDDIYTLIVLMDNGCRGYVCWEDFARFVDLILHAMKRYDSTHAHSVQFLQDTEHEAFRAAVNLVRDNCVNNAHNPIDHSLERQLSQFASTARKAGLSPLSTLCAIGSKSAWLHTYCICLLMMSCVILKQVNNNGDYLPSH